MSPISRQAVKLTQRIRNPTLRNLTLSLIEDASQKPDLAHFTIAILKNLTMAETHRIRVIPTSSLTPQHCLQPRNNSKTTKLRQLTSTTMNKGAILVMFYIKKERTNRQMSEVL
ncbi:hypothetical protein I7I51_03280 [Histoplasma capsulatum]|uniref:Uncharacterized protein n=1 Tax=Ajellomyces capsulatus TaxID=5037 RepID=A0A8A1M3S4_AJECA|nr:hypothetical protein I7I51_03280 [Histoplasma capsulatum]